jgi:predicted 3-demethylubiquinone-9 3-methyltransferase (glyoxalase superfamily)
MKGKVITAIFELNGQRFMALDGGPIFKFNEAVSFYVECADQDEVDYFWKKLSADPESEQCGWLKDKFGLSWQVGHAHWAEMLDDTDRARAGRVMQAVMGMTKIDLAKIKQAVG